MEKTIAFLISILLFTSCLTISRIENNCDKFAKVCLSDEVTTIIYRDTTIYLTDTVAIILPTDTIIIIDTIGFDSIGMASLPTLYKESGLIWMRAGVAESVINVSAGLIDSTILTPITDTITLDNVITKTITEKAVVLPPIKFVPTIFKISLFISIFQLIIVVVWLIFRGKMKIIKNKFFT